MGTVDQPFNPPYSLTQFQNGISSQSQAVLGIAPLTLTSAQLKALQTTPVTIVPSPSTLQVDGVVSLWLIPKRLSLEYVFKTTAYTIGNADNAFRLEYIGKTTSLAAPLATGLVDQTASTVVTVGPSAAGNLAVTNVKNLGFELKLIGTTPALTLGDGTVVVNFEYTAVVLV